MTFGWCGAPDVSRHVFEESVAEVPGDCVEHGRGCEKSRVRGVFFDPMLEVGVLPPGEDEDADPFPDAEGPDRHLGRDGANLPGLREGEDHGHGGPACDRGPLVDWATSPTRAQVKYGYDSSEAEVSMVEARPLQARHPRPTSRLHHPWQAWVDTKNHPSSQS